MVWKFEEGERRGRLTAITRYKAHEKYYEVLCRCDCGNLVAARTGDWSRDRYQSCGCLRRELGRAHMMRIHYTGGRRGTFFTQRQVKMYRSMQYKKGDKQAMARRLGCNPFHVLPHGEGRHVQMGKVALLLLLLTPAITCGEEVLAACVDYASKQQEPEFVRFVYGASNEGEAGVLSFTLNSISFSSRISYPVQIGKPEWGLFAFDVRSYAHNESVWRKRMEPVGRRPCIHACTNRC